MKLKIILLITALSVLTITGFAQDTGKGLYVKINAGHSVFTPGSDPLLGSTIFFYVPGYDSPGLNSNGKYGSGFYFGIGLQKDLSKLVAAGLDINYLAGKTLTANGQTLPDYSVPYKYTAEGKLSFMTAVPNISFKVYNAPRYQVYTKLGFILAFNTKYSTKQTFAYQTFALTNNFDDKFKYGLNTGVQAGAGILFHLSGNLQGFAELSNNFISVSPTSLHSDDNQSNNNQQVIFHHDITFIKSNSGTLTDTEQSTTNGGVETITTSSNWRSIYHHSNSTVLSVGVVFAIK